MSPFGEVVNQDTDFIRKQETVFTICYVEQLR